MCIQFRYRQTVDKSKCFTFLIRNSHRPRAQCAIHPGAIMCDIIADRTSGGFLHHQLYEKSFAVWVNTGNQSAAICSRTRQESASLDYRLTSLCRG